MKLPRYLSGHDLAAALCQRWGYLKVNQVGSHIILQTQDPTPHRVAIPAHEAMRPYLLLLRFPHPKAAASPSAGRRWLTARHVPSLERPRLSHNCRSVATSSAEGKSSKISAPRPPVAQPWRSNVAFHALRQPELGGQSGVRRDTASVGRRLFTILSPHSTARY